MKTSQLPTLDFLKSNCDKIHYFGLGFVQLKMKNPQVRYHFYNKELPRIVSHEEIHNHRYAFESKVLVGELDQVLYNIVRCTSDEATHTMRPVSCDPKLPVPKSADKAVWSTAIPCFVSKHTAGSAYRITPASFHNVFSDYAITHINRGETLYNFAMVVRKIGVPPVCPFSAPGTENELWELVDSMLKYPEAPQFELCKTPDPQLSQESTDEPVKVDVR